MLSIEAQTRSDIADVLLLLLLLLLTLPRSSPPVSPLYPYVRYDLYGRRPHAAHEPEQVQLPSASAGGADPVSSGASVSPDHLIT